jgi:hypothetical protein
MKGDIIICIILKKFHNLHFCGAPVCIIVNFDVLTPLRIAFVWLFRESTCFILLTL